VNPAHHPGPCGVELNLRTGSMPRRLGQENRSSARNHSRADVGSAPALRRRRAAFARRVLPGRAGTGQVRGGRRRSPAGPLANDLRPLAPSAESSARVTRPAARIGRKRPAPVAPSNSNPGRSGVRRGGCRTVFDWPGRRRPPSGLGVGIGQLPAWASTATNSPDDRRERSSPMTAGRAASRGPPVDSYRQVTGSK
jgi:hypothetical protein